MVKEKETLKAIIADTDLKTFEDLKNLSEIYSTLFLSSDFAVNFILEYEKIDTVLISNRISNLNSIINRINKKNISMYIFGRDIKYPVNYNEVDKILKMELEKKLAKNKKDIPIFKKKLKEILNKKNKIFKLREEGPVLAERRIREKSDTKEKSEKKTIGDKNKINKILIKKKNEDIKIPEISKIKNDNSNLSNNNEKSSFRDLTLKRYSPLKKEMAKFKKVNIKIIKQKVLVLTKAKGGVGSTTIGLFLSSILKDFSILLIDLNFNEGGGDISYYLNIPKTPNILNFLDGYSKESLDNAVIKFRNNLDILQSPPTFEQSKRVDLQDIYCLTDIAKKKYHLLIIDLPNQLGDMWLGVMDLADLIILVSDSSIGSIGRLLKINNRYLYKGLEKLLVLNMCDNQNSFNNLNSYTGNFFGLNEYVVVEENDILRKKTDFANLNFENLTGFSNLTNRVLELVSN
jgi:MinD-like ATPase involved in chromosome partitioning or flagellar assembly